MSSLRGQPPSCRRHRREERKPASPSSRPRCKPGLRRRCSRRSARSQQRMGWMPSATGGLAGWKRLVPIGFSWSRWWICSCFAFDILDFIPIQAASYVYNMSLRCLSCPFLFRIFHPIDAGRPPAAIPRPSPRSSGLPSPKMPPRVALSPLGPTSSSPLWPTTQGENCTFPSYNCYFSLSNWWHQMVRWFLLLCTCESWAPADCCC
jgi:hypothetical protein